MKKSHTHAKHLWYASINPNTDMTSKLSNKPSVTNGVGEKAWKPKSDDCHGIYKYETNVTRFVSLKWTQNMVDANENENYPISIIKEINTLTLPEF